MDKFLCFLLVKNWCFARVEQRFLEKFRSKGEMRKLQKIVASF